MTKNVIQERCVRRIATFGIDGKLQLFLQAQKKTTTCIRGKQGGR